MSRQLVNLVTVVIASVVLLLYATTQLLASAILDNNYPLFIELPEAGGLLENKEVTYRGNSIGEIVDVTLCGDDTVEARVPECADEESVMVEMGVSKDVQVPQGVDVVVLRQSAVGEQALDFRPLAPIGDATTYYDENDLVRPGSVQLPTKTQELLEVAEDVFSPVDPENAAIVVRELADAVEGRTEDLQSILVDSASLSEAVADNGADFDRFFASSVTVNRSLAENRVALGDILTDLANGAELIGDIRDEIDGLLTTAPPVLDTTTRLLERSDANLSCIIRDLGNLNAFINIPENQQNLAEALRVNDFFFDAFRIIGPTSVQGDPWLRVQLIAQPVPVPLEYVPSRPIPATLPGGACSSVFGPGAGSAVQANHQLAVPEGEVIRPGNDRQTSFAQNSTVPVTLAAQSEQVVPVDPFAVTADQGRAAAAPVAGLVIVMAAGLLALGARTLRARAESVVTGRPVRRGRR